MYLVVVSSENGFDHFMIVQIDAAVPGLQVGAPNTLDSDNEKICE